MSLLHFEDFRVGTVQRYGSYTLSRDEIIAFATQFDPQPIHLDEEVAARSLLGGLAASGWNICAIMALLITKGFLANSACMGAPGIDELKWLVPVRPGDILSVRHTVLETRASRTKPDRGFVKFRFEVLNQKEEVVQEQTNTIIFATRAGGVAQ
jgi:acyl dehydratase